MTFNNMFATRIFSSYVFDFTSFAVIVAKAIYLRLISMKLSRQLFDFTSFAEIITKAILISEIDTARQS